MSKLIRSLAAAGVLVLFSPAVSRADDDVKSYDARLEGHADNVTLPGGAPALSWLVLAGLGVLCVGVMFKNAKRSHLD